MIRIATKPSDLRKIQDLDTEVIGHSNRHAYLAQRFEAHAIHIAVQGSTLVGFACLDPNQFFDRRFLSLLIVAPEARRQGVGAALLDHLASGPGPLWTSTNQSNAPMRALLAKADFIPCGEIHGLDEDDPELIVRSAHGNSDG